MSYLNFIKPQLLFVPCDRKLRRDIGLWAPDGNGNKMLTFFSGREDGKDQRKYRRMTPYEPSTAKASAYGTHDIIKIYDHHAGQMYYGGRIACVLSSWSAVLVPLIQNGITRSVGYNESSRVGQHFMLVKQMLPSSGRRVNYTRELAQFDIVSA